MLLFFFLVSQCLAWPFSHKPSTSASVGAQLKNMTTSVHNVSTHLQTWTVKNGVQELYMLRRQVDPLPHLIDQIKTSVGSAQIADIGESEFLLFENNLTAMYKIMDKGYKNYDDVGMATSIGTMVDKTRMPLMDTILKISKLTKKDCKKASAWSKPTTDLAAAMANIAKTYQMSKLRVAFPSITPCSTAPKHALDIVNQENNQTYLGIDINLNGVDVDVNGDPISADSIQECLVSNFENYSNSTQSDHEARATSSGVVYTAL